MKRSGFKRKPQKGPAKRSKLRKLGKSPISLIQRKLWQLCKEIIRKRYGNICYTCGRAGLEGSNWHTGHMWPKAALGAYLKYDLRVLRPQDYHCNINLGGNGAVFYVKMLAEIGPEKMAQLEKDRQVTVRAYDHYSQLLIEYTKLNEELNS